MYNIATLKGLKCPHCGSEKLTVTGTKGALGAAIATSVAFGAIGNLVAGSNAASNQATEPLKYKCASCGKKFETFPLLAPAQDVMPAPYTVTFTRAKSFIGAVVPQIVYLNGVKLGAVKNGKSITFTTINRYNSIFVTDQYGVAFKSVYSFEAQPGGNVSVRFKRKFIGTRSTPINIAPIPMVTENVTRPHVNFCSNCGKSLAAEDMFCTYCGEKRFS